MKATEIQKCACCRQPVRAPFYVVRVSLAVPDHHAARQTMSLAMMFGGALGLAEVMSPNADVIKVAGDEKPELLKERHICMECAGMNSLCVAELIEGEPEYIVPRAALPVVCEGGEA